MVGWRLATVWNHSISPLCLQVGYQKRIFHMMTSSNGSIFALLALCAGNSPVTGEFPSETPVTRSSGVFFDLRLNNRLNKQSWGWWFEMLSLPLWRHCNDIHYIYIYIKRSLSQFAVKFCLHLVLLFAPISHFLIYTSPKYFVFFVWYIQKFFVYCSDSSYLLWRMTMYFSAAHPSYEIAIITLTLGCYFVMVGAEQRAGHFMW